MCHTYNKEYGNEENSNGWYKQIKDFFFGNRFGFDGFADHSVKVFWENKEVYPYDSSQGRQKNSIDRKFWNNFFHNTEWEYKHD